MRTNIWSFVDSGGEWSQFLLLRNDLTEKNHFSWIAALLEAQKLPKWIVKVCTSNEVSSGLVWARFPHKILKESSNRSEIFRAVGKKVNKKVNNEELGLFRALNERGEALVALFKPNEKPKHKSKCKSTLFVLCVESKHRCPTRSSPMHFLLQRRVELYRWKATSHCYNLSGFQSCSGHTIYPTCHRIYLIFYLIIEPSSYPLPNKVCKGHNASPLQSTKVLASLALHVFSFSGRKWPLSHPKCNSRTRKDKLIRIPNFPCKNQPFQNRTYRGLVSQRLLRSGDIESNPGPGHGRQQEGPSVMVTSLNVRGLSDEKKLRHLINECYRKSGNSVNQDSFFGFQETYIEQEGKIPFLWRGNFHLTNGNGHSCGCLTLLSSHINVVHSVEFSDRGHLLVCQKVGDHQISYIIVNIYAPCPNTQGKIAFFEEVFDAISKNSILYECENIIVMGDFNLNFNAREMKNRLFSPQESRLSKIVVGFYQGLNLTDIWERTSTFTWRRPNSDIFSTIDRILYSKSLLEISKVNVNWAFSQSDHAAIEASFKSIRELN